LSDGASGARATEESLPIVWIRRIGGMSLFLAQILARIVPSFRKPGLIVRQIYNAGARSLVIIMLSGLFVGMVLGLLGFDTLQRFGSEDSLGVLAALGMLKVLGPVLTALLFAGRAGTSLTSEIGLMRSTEQLTAMQMMAVDPLRHVVTPRFLGGVIAMPLLAATFSVIGLFGAQLIGVQQMGVDVGAFWSQTQDAVDLRDVTEGIVKSLVFGVACSLIAVYEGYQSEPTPEGVGLATTRTVVTSSVMVLLLNYLLTAAFLTRA
jgi:phospholipid/cholesterol/gamma-HCH transport system permease protein